MATKLKTMATSIEAGKGPLAFLGICLRDDSPELWDVVIAASWMGEEGDRFGYVANRLYESLDKDELANISRIVILEYGGDVHLSFIEQFKGRTGLCEVHFATKGGAVIRRAYIILARAIPSTPPQLSVDVIVQLEGKTYLLIEAKHSGSASSSVSDAPAPAQLAVSATTGSPPSRGVTLPAAKAGRQMPVGSQASVAYG